MREMIRLLCKYEVDAIADYLALPDGPDRMRAMQLASSYDRLLMVLDTEVRREFGNLDRDSIAVLRE
jgi:hypothetical protein